MKNRVASAIGRALKGAYRLLRTWLSSLHNEDGRVVADEDVQTTSRSTRESIGCVVSTSFLPDAAPSPPTPWELTSRLGDNQVPFEARPSGATSDGAHDLGTHSVDTRTGYPGKSAGAAEAYRLPAVMSVEQTATFLGLNVKTVYAAIEGGTLPGKKIGPRRVVVFRDALLTWLQTSERRRSAQRCR